MKRLIGLVVVVSCLGLASAQRVNVLCSPDLAWCEALGPAFREATGLQISEVKSIQKRLWRENI